MAAIVETFRKVAIVGDLKFITIKTSAAAATSDTIDLGSDAANARGVSITEILNTIAQDDVGADVTGTFAPATGIYTFGTITTGIHCITFIGY